MRDFRFRIQRVFVGADRRFQLRVGLDGDRELEYVPAHTTAYAQRLTLKEGHVTEGEAVQEKDALLAWLKKHTPNTV